MQSSCSHPMLIAISLNMGSFELQSNKKHVQTEEQEGIAVILVCREPSMYNICKMQQGQKAHVINLYM
jgi:hypothetical protein